MQQRGLIIFAFFLLTTRWHQLVFADQRFSSVTVVHWFVECKGGSCLCIFNKFRKLPKQILNLII